MVLHLKSRLDVRHVFRKYTPHNVIMMQISLSTLNLKVTLKMYNVLTCKNPYEKLILVLTNRDTAIAGQTTLFP